MDLALLFISNHTCMYPPYPPHYTHTLTTHHAYLLLGESRVNDEHNPINSQGGLGNIRRDHHLPAYGPVGFVGGSGLKNPLLKVGGQRGVEGDAFERPHVRSKILNLSLKPLTSFFYFL